MKFLLYFIGEVSLLLIRNLQISNRSIIWIQAPTWSILLDFFPLTCPDLLSIFLFPVLFPVRSTWINYINKLSQGSTNKRSEGSKKSEVKVFPTLPFSLCNYRFTEGHSSCQAALSGFW